MMTLASSATVQFARALFTRGTDIFGAEELSQVFGIEMSEDAVPPIPFTEEELVRARELGQVLVLQVPDVTMQMVHDWRQNRTSDSKPLCYNTDWYREEKFFTSDSTQPGWRLVTRDVIPGSRNENYLGQTDALCAYVVEVFGADLPDAVREAVAEFRSQTQELTKLLDRDWQEAARRLVALKVNQMFRESPAETLYSLALYEAVNHERLLPSGTWSWTNSLSSDGSVVDVGGFGEGGGSVDSDGPRDRGDGLGLRFSRSGKLE